uniref:Uncharacterized protein n=1 Tax=Odontella aurita TaxID=265563 RepID=A0A7S4MWJ6_9STRA
MRLLLALSIVISSADAFSVPPQYRHARRNLLIATEHQSFHSSNVHAGAPPALTLSRRSATKDETDAEITDVVADENAGDASEEAGGDGGADEGQSAPLDLTDEDRAVVDQVLSGFPESVPLEDRVAAAMGGMHPRLVMALRRAADSSDDYVSDDPDLAGKLREVGAAMTSLLDGRLKDGRDLLEALLKSGEIRKLDGLIGGAARDGKLDMAFFSVLNMNLRDAAYEESSMSPEERAKLEETRVGVPMNEDSGSTDRLQILQHIYTRCQEEVEKTVAPGAGLLNKLLRTEVAAIRSNQLKHYLGPQSNTVKTPDGKEIQLEGQGKALVPMDDFIEALANAVRQIRTVEQAGGASRETAADLVESIRQIAIEGRFAVGEVYGTTSEELRQYEDGLQPVFRPGTANSEYIKGN